MYVGAFVRIPVDVVACFVMTLVVGNDKCLSDGAVQVLLLVVACTGQY